MLIGDREWFLYYGVVNISGIICLSGNISTLCRQVISVQSNLSSKTHIAVSTTMGLQPEALDSPFQSLESRLFLGIWEKSEDESRRKGNDDSIVIFAIESNRR